MRARSDLYADELVTPKYAPSPKGGTPLPMQVAFAGMHFHVIDGKLLTAGGQPIELVCDVATGKWLAGGDDCTIDLTDLIESLKANGHISN